MTVPSDLAARIRTAVAESEADIVATCLEWANLHDLAGEELPVAEAVAAAYRDMGLETRLQHLGSTSANVIGIRRAMGASGTAPTLVLNSHLDTEGGIPSGGPLERSRLRDAWREDETLIGKGLVNAKLHLVAQLFALRALDECDARLAGEIVLTAAAQETGGAPDPRADSTWTGPHVNEGVGTTRLLESGLSGDYALVGEPTGFSIAAVQAGYVRLRVAIHGFMPYTPFVERGSTVQEDSNPFERAGPVLTALREWAIRYEKVHRVDFRGSTIVPKAQVHALKAGSAPFTERSDECLIFVDVRTTPSTRSIDVIRSVQAAVAAVDPQVSVDAYDQRRGHAAKGAESLIDAVTEAHRAVFGEPPPPPHPSQISMWQDTNAFNAAGIPAISYGIRPVRENRTREGVRGARIDDILHLTSVYALAVAHICRSE